MTFTRCQKRRAYGKSQKLYLMLFNKITDINGQLKDIQTQAELEYLKEDEKVIKYSNLKTIIIKIKIKNKAVLNIAI